MKIKLDKNSFKMSRFAFFLQQKVWDYFRVFGLLAVEKLLFRHRLIQWLLSMERESEKKGAWFERGSWNVRYDVTSKTDVIHSWNDIPYCVKINSKTARIFCSFLDDGWLIRHFVQIHCVTCIHANCLAIKRVSIHWIHIVVDPHI